jgi:hypothetical protein
MARRRPTGHPGRSSATRGAPFAPRRCKPGVAAAFGEALGRLIWIDHEWTVGHADYLLTQDAFGDVVLSTALATYHPSRALLEVVAPAARATVERVAGGGTAVSGWRTVRSPVELIGGPSCVVAHPRCHRRRRSTVRSILPESAGAGPRQGSWASGLAAQAIRRGSAEYARPSCGALGEPGYCRNPWRSDCGRIGRFHQVGSRNKFKSTWCLPHLRQASTSDDFDPMGTFGECWRKQRLRGLSRGKTALLVRGAMPPRTGRLSSI